MMNPKILLLIILVLFISLPLKSTNAASSRPDFNGEIFFQIDGDQLVIELTSFSLPIFIDLVRSAFKHRSNQKDMFVVYKSVAKYKLTSPRTRIRNLSEFSGFIRKCTNGKVRVHQQNEKFLILTLEESLKLGTPQGYKERD